MSNDAIMYTLPGRVNRSNGLFEIGVRPSSSGKKTEVILHRFFKADPK
ncbi:hypothetical protein MES5069_70380 [Mesorhizobium escarrei]|uniref:Uncharacterized protein n=1 Tax=Mesorhizobium escarrei TaxID=666018 RepID=A0ABM9EHB3_9HYPH|nr:hypothetical protein MES5069_70380 [Mesorhizobium escarrei]